MSIEQLIKIEEKQVKKRILIEHVHDLVDCVEKLFIAEVITKDGFEEIGDKIVQMNIDGLYNIDNNE